MAVFEGSAAAGEPAATIVGCLHAFQIDGGHFAVAA
jgi:hypothetical protein